MNNPEKYTASIIIPTYNRSKLLDYTLNSIVNQSFSKDKFEVIVVDDGSNDNTAEVINKYKSLLNLQYFFQEDKGYRVSTARNIGIENAAGELCVFIDSGVILGTNCLHEHVLYYYQSPSSAVLGYVYGFSNNNNEGKKLHGIIDPHQPDTSIEYFIKTYTYMDLRESFYKKYNDNLAELPAPWVFFWATNISIPRKTLYSVGLFDSNYDFNWGAEDIDLGYRLFKNDIKILLNRKAASIHLPHEKDEEENARQHSKNLQLFHQKFNTSETALFLDVTWELNEKLPSPKTDSNFNLLKTNTTNGQLIKE